MKHLPPLFALSLIAIFTAQSTAQTLNSPNARITINGTEGSVVDPSPGDYHNVDVSVPGNLFVRVQSNNPFSPLVMLVSPVSPDTANGPGTPLPWGDTMDIGLSMGGMPVMGSFFSLCDGVGLTVNPITDAFCVTNGGIGLLGIPPEYLVAFGVNSALAGFHVAFQAMIVDPTSPPFNLRNTEVVDANFGAGQRLGLMTGDDGVVGPVPFLGGKSFPFHGVVYPDLTVAANGFVTFGGPTNLAGAGFANDNAGFLADVPAIAAALTDWDPARINPLDGVAYDEFGTVARVTWGDPEFQILGGIAHANDVDVNRFEILLELDDPSLPVANPLAGSFQLSYPLLDQNTGSNDFGDGLLGHTPGGVALVGGSFDQHLRLTPQASAANVAQVEEHDRTATAIAPIGFDGLGTPRNYNGFTSNWDGADVIFSPNPPVSIPGDAGYSSQPTAMPPPDDFIGFDRVQLARAGGEAVVANGSFLNFDPAGSGMGNITFDPLGVNGGPYVVDIGSPLVIPDGTGLSGIPSVANPQPSPFRDSQSLLFTTPSFSGSQPNPSFRVDVNFSGGATFTTTVALVLVPSTITNFLLGDDAFVNHVLSIPICFYGTIYPSLFIGSNGFVTFGQGSTAFSETEAELFSGLGGSTNPAVAVFFSDLNRGGVASGASYDVIEDNVDQSVRVEFNNQNHWSSQESAGSFSCTFDTSSQTVTLDYVQFLAATTATNDGVIGVSNGNPFLGIDTSFSNGLGTGTAGAVGTYLSGVTPDSIAETIPANVSPGINSIIGAPVYRYTDVIGFGRWQIH